MRVGNLSEGALLQLDLGEEIDAQGELLLVTRILEDKTRYQFSATCLPQVLTPTFVHNLAEEGGENLLENDQHDFVFSGLIQVIENDIFSWDNKTWVVSTTGDLRRTGQIATLHALCVRFGEVTLGL